MKNMNISSVLITFVAVNVLADENEKYAEKVAITNEHIRLAFLFRNYKIENGLEELISTVLNKNQFSTGTYNYMFTVPELAREGDEYHILDDMHPISQQDYVQTQISELLGIPVPDIINQNFQNMNNLIEERRINPTEDNIRNRIVNSAANLLQFFGQARRNLTRKALKNLIRLKLEDYLEYCEYKYSARMQNVLTFCKYLALWKSAKTSLLTIVDIKHNGDCILKYGDNLETKYSYFLGKVWEEVNGVKIKELKVQLHEDEEEDEE